MCRSSIVFWCYVFLLGASSSDSLGYSTNNNERRGNQTTRYDLVNSTKDRDDEMQPILYNLRENSTKNDGDVQHASRVNSDDSARYKYHGHIMTFHKENDQMFMESRANPAGVDDEIYSMLQAFNENLTKTDRENNSMSYELHRNFNTDDYNDTRVNITSYEACDNETCIQLCCPYGDRLTSEKKCIAGRGNYYFPAVYRNDSGSKRLNELFQLTVRDPCVLQGSAHRVLNPKEYLFFVNGSLYQDSDKIVSSTSYCLGVLDRDIYDAVVCLEQIGFPTYISVCLLVSLPFLLLTFVVYSILPEVQNIHSCTLRVHVASLFISNLLIFCIQEVPELSEWKYCIPLAYIFNFSMLSGCFWLNATCFDIWWTFKKLNLHQPNIRKKKRKFLMYSIYAWGVTFGLNVACVIMDYAPGIPKNLIRPEMCEKKFWLGEKALTVYFYGPTGAAFISNVCFFFGTALAILYHNKHTAHQLRDSESRRYDRKKRKFGMYLKLFTVMGISWSMGIILWLISANNSIPQIIWDVSYTIDILQGVIIFAIYVCKKKIVRLLIKRFGWQTRGPFWDISTSSNHTRTSSKVSSLSSLSDTLPMQNINPSINQQINHHVEYNVTS